MEQIVALTIKFRQELEPFFEFLMDKRIHLDQDNWLAVVKRIEHSVLNDPDQYLSGHTKKNKALVHRIVRNLFEELLANPSNPESGQHEASN